MIGIAPSHKNQLSNYTAWLEKRNLPYKILQPGESLAGCAMLMLCGGPDVGSQPDRDDREIRWFNEAYRKIPIIGICRGFQLANTNLGGTLYEDLSEDTVKHTKNKLEIAGEPQISSDSSWHNIDFVNGKTMLVNSRHHQGIDKLAHSLIPVACSVEDRLIEMAIGAKSLFVQWHPEREDVWGTEAEQIVYDWIMLNIDQNESGNFSIPTASPIEKIHRYMINKGFTVVSNERVRKSIDSSYTDDFISKLITENSTIAKRVYDKFGAISIKIQTK